MKYTNLVQQIRWQVLDGQLAEGAQLPTETALVRSSGLARGTVRRALEQLATEGLVRSEHGIGWFVTRQRPDALPFRMHEAQTGQFRVLAQERESASVGVAEQLRIAPYSPIIHIAQLQLIAGKPVSLTERRLLLELCPALLTLDLTQHSAGDLLATHAATQPTRATFTIETCRLGDQEAELLEVAPGSSAIVVERMTYTSPTQPAVWHRGLFLSTYQLMVAF